MNLEQPRPPHRHRPALVLTVALFFLWGMANNLNDILIAQFRHAFRLSDFATSFVQQVFYIGYFLFALPAATLAQRHGYKVPIVVGLLLYGVGAMLFYPAARYGEYHYFLVALFVIASGLAFLETAANPLIVELGDPAGATRRLTLAQAANPVGTLAGVLVGRWFILSRLDDDPARLAALPVAARAAALRGEVTAVQTPYLVLGLVVLATAVTAMAIRFPTAAAGEAAVPGPAARKNGGFRAALRHPALRRAVIAQFCYVGAQVGLWSYTIRYAADQAAMPEREGADMLFASLVLFGAGRFAGPLMMRHVALARLLGGFALAASALMLVAALGGGRFGLYALVLASFFMSIQFPTIFSLGIAELGAARREGAAAIVMAIIGGAAMTALMGLVSDHGGIRSAMLVPGGCFLIVLAFAAGSHRTPRQGRRRPA